VQAESDRFRASLELPFPLVGDPQGEITKAYDVRWPVIGKARRVTYVIGPNHKVRIAFHSEFDAEAHVTKACEVMASPPEPETQA
jgi:peroxiredoxin